MTVQAPKSRLRAAYEGAGFNRTAFAAEVGVDPTTVWRWETRGTGPTSRMALASIGRALRLDVPQVRALFDHEPDHNERAA